MQYVTLEDEAGLAEAVLNPNAYSLLDDPIRDAGAYIVDGRVVEDRGDIHLAITSVTPFHLRQRPYENGGPVRT